MQEVVRHYSKGYHKLLKNHHKSMQAFLVLWLCTLLIIGCSKPYQGEQAMSAQATIFFNSVAIWPWDDDVPLKIVDVQPPAGGAFIELPGPKRRPVRAYLEPFASLGGLAARLVQADGQVEPLILLVNEAGPSLMPILVPPLALTVREDGHIWVLTQNELSHYETNGHKLFSLELVGQTLVGSINNSVWVVGHKSAWFVEPNGQISQQYAWQGGINSSGGENGMLCTLEKGKSVRVRCLTPDGEEKLMTLPLSARPMERLLTVNDQEFLTISGSTLRRYDATGLIAQVTVQSAGFTDNGEVFASGREGDWINLWVPNKPQRISLPSGLPKWGAFRVVAVKDGSSLIYGLDMAAWYDGSELKERVVVDEESYRSQVFPHLWSLSSTRSVTAKPNGTIILSASGPKGVGLIELRWEMGG